MQGTGTAADRALVESRYPAGVMPHARLAMLSSIAIACTGGSVFFIAGDRPEAKNRALGFLPDAHYDNEPRVTETPKRPRVWLPVIQPEAKPLRDRKRILARKRK